MPMMCQLTGNARPIRMGALGRAEHENGVRADIRIRCERPDRAAMECLRTPERTSPGMPPNLEPTRGRVEPGPALAEN
jgi:hypothetical protein